MEEADSGGAAAEAAEAADGAERSYRAGSEVGMAWSDRVVAAATVVAVVAVVVTWADEVVTAVVLAAFVAVLGRLSAIDLRERRLPNRIVGPLAGAAVGAVVLHGLLTGDVGRLGPALATGLGFSVALVGLALVGQVGMGDVKFAFPLGVIAGWLGGVALPATVATTLLSSSVVAAAALAAGRGRHHTLPFGPFLALGSLAGILAVRLV